MNVEADGLHQWNLGGRVVCLAAYAGFVVRRVYSQIQFARDRVIAGPRRTRPDLPKVKTLVI